MLHRVKPTYGDQGGFIEKDVCPVLKELWGLEASLFARLCNLFLSLMLDRGSMNFRNLGLNDQEVNDIVVYLRTLTDGYSPEP
jgi:hypothetical protein